MGCCGDQHCKCALPGYHGLKRVKGDQTKFCGWYNLCRLFDSSHHIRSSCHRNSKYHYLILNTQKLFQLTILWHYFLDYRKRRSWTPGTHLICTGALEAVPRNALMIASPDPPWLEGCLFKTSSNPSSYRTQIRGLSGFVQYPARSTS